LTPTNDLEMFYRWNHVQSYAFVVAQGVPLCDCSDVTQNLYVRLNTALGRFDMSRAVSSGGDVTAIYNSYISRQIVWTCKDYLRNQAIRYQRVGKLKEAWDYPGLFQDEVYFEEDPLLPCQ
jgi:hypothetical protein